MSVEGKRTKGGDEGDVREDRRGRGGEEDADLVASSFESSIQRNFPSQL